MSAPLAFDAVIVAGGQGLRTGLPLPKQYALLGSRPVLLWSVDAFAAHPGCRTIVIVVPAGEEARTRNLLGARDATITVGGETRQQSVLAGLQQLSAIAGLQQLSAIPGGQSAAQPIVMVHDAARPGLRREVIDRLLDALADVRHAGAVPTIAIADTLARADGMLGDILGRDGVVRVQTPQAFRLASLLAAHARWTQGTASDDAQIVRAAGGQVATVRGDARLEKITYAGDIEMIGAMVRGERNFSQRTAVGMGYDVHRLIAGDGLWLCGIFLPHDRGLEGHSDADVALHAITDAILGTIAAGDIGTHFPPSDPQWRGAASDQFLLHARNLVIGLGGTIGHIDCTIICEQPKVGPHRQAMQARVAELLGIDASRVSIKATTTERLGFAGRGEGIAAQAIATITLPDGEASV